MSGASSSHPKRGSGRTPPTAATLLTGDFPRCCFCGQVNLAENCARVGTAEERKQMLFKSGRCFVCLRRGHLVRQCRSKSRCTGCGGRHHVSICAKPAAPDPPQENPSTTTTGLNPSAPSFDPPTIPSLLVNAKGPVLLQTAKVKLFNPDRPEQTVEVRAVLDTGSQQSYTTKKVQDTLTLRPLRKRDMSVLTFGSSDQTSHDYDVVELGVQTKDGERKKMEFYSVPLICQPLTSQPIDLCKERYRHLADIELADSDRQDNDQKEVNLLIGSGYYWLFVTGEMRRTGDGPVAINTKFGWVLSGNLPVDGQGVTSHNFLTTHVLRVEALPSIQENLDEVLRSFWKLESLGVEPKVDSVLEEFTQTVKFKEGRYEVSLLWKESHPRLPDKPKLIGWSPSPAEE